MDQASAEIAERSYVQEASSGLSIFIISSQWFLFPLKQLPNGTVFAVLLALPHVKEHIETMEHLRKNATGTSPESSLATPSPRKRVRSSRSDDLIRTFLVIWTAILTLLIIVAYLYTKDIRVLLGGTVVAIAVTFVYAYYFRQRR